MGLFSAIGSAFGPIGSVIGAGADLALSSDRDDKKEDLAVSQFNQNVELQREFAKNGIRWKVEDAKAAGLHPLFAIGGQGAAYAPSAVSVGGDSVAEAMSQAGQNVSRAIQAQQTAQEREKHEASIQVLRAQAARDTAQAAYYDSLASRGAQGDAISAPLYGAFGQPPITFKYLGPEGQNPRSGNGAPAPTTLESFRRSAGQSAIKVDPDKQVTNRPGEPAVGASENPFWNEHIVMTKPGRVPIRVMLPRSDEGPGEALENLGIMSYPAFLRENLNRYGAGWLLDFFGLRDGAWPEGYRPVWKNMFRRGSTGRW